MAFARDVADIAIFMDNGIILEKGSAKELINNPKKRANKAVPLKSERQIR